VIAVLIAVSEVACARCSGWRSLLLISSVTLSFSSPVLSQTAPVGNLVTEVQVLDGGTSRTIQGLLRAESSDGTILLEDALGKYHLLPPTQMQRRQQTSAVFQKLSDEDLMASLLAEVGDGFEVAETEHFLICTNSGAAYAEFCGKLLEKVYAEFFTWSENLQLSLTPPPRRLPILIFAAESEFQAHAVRIHPETPFENTPGFYTVRDNQVLLWDLTRDRSLRFSAIRKKLSESPLQLATIVHEAVHQLAFNSGLQSRFADNPLWFSEGLALYFEQVSLRSPLLWSKPGLINSRHHPEFLRRTADERVPIPLPELLTSDRTFQTVESAPAAYAQSWALMAWLVRQHPEQLAQYIRQLQALQPLQPVSADHRIQMFQESLGSPLEEIPRDLIAWARRQRSSR
jgi:hypothetical protein